MKYAETAAAIQPCSKCGTPLEVKGNPPGTWVACPGCGQPMQVRRRVPIRPAEPEPMAALPEIAWVEDPRTTPAAAAESAVIPAPFSPPVRAQTPAPDSWKARRRQRGPILMLTLISAIANALFAGLFLPLSRTEEVLIAGCFGGLLGLFVATMAASAVRKHEGR